MMPWREALAALAQGTVRLRMLVPPYPAVGLGVLRALRVRAGTGADDGGFELTAGYDGYERI